MWISFLIPKIEDGNNFGVSIQEGICIKKPKINKKFHFIDLLQICWLKSEQWKAKLLPSLIRFHGTLSLEAKSSAK